MAKKKIVGTCHLCGSHGKLSFEHVPPKSAFNDSPAIQLKLSDTFHRDLNGSNKGKIVQRGAGDYTLCERCNNVTGDWYAKYYTDFCFQAVSYIVANDGAPSLVYPYHIYPLKVIKQIITMVASVDGEKFSQKDPELTAFVLDRERRYMNPNYRVFLYFNLSGLRRRVGRGVTKVSLYGPFRIQQVVEVSHFPFGFVFTADGSRPADELIEITHFARYDYDEYEMIQLKLPDLPTHLGIPLDYRTWDQIEDQRLQSLRDFPEP